VEFDMTVAVLGVLLIWLVSLLAKPTPSRSIRGPFALVLASLPSAVRSALVAAFDQVGISPRMVRAVFLPHLPVAIAPVPRAIVRNRIVREGIPGSPHDPG
jgi:hypothetical protein